MSLPATQNFVVGAGYIRFNPLNAQGQYTGQRYLGDSPGLSLQVSTQRVEAYSSDGPIAEKIVDAPTRVDRAGSFQVQNISGENLGLFVIGDLSILTTSAGSRTGDPINNGVALIGGRWYQLGVDATYPDGVRKITNTDILDSLSASVLADVVLDDDLAKFYVVEGGGADGEICTADFDLTDVSWELVTANDLGTKEGELHFEAANTDGENRDILIPRARLIPDGTLDWKSRQNVMQMGFQVVALKPTDGRAALYINGRAA